MNIRRILTFVVLSFGASVSGDSSLPALASNQENLPFVVFRTPDTQMGRRVFDKEIWHETSQICGK